MIDAFHCQDSRPKSYWDLPRIPELTLICPDLWHKLPFDQPFQKTATNSSSFVSATSIFWLRWPNHDSWPAVPPLSTYLNLPIPEQQPAYTLRSWKSQGTSPFALQRWLRIEPCKFRVTLTGTRIDMRTCCSSVTVHGITCNVHMYMCVICSFIYAYIFCTWCVYEYICVNNLSRYMIHISIVYTYVCFHDGIWGNPSTKSSEAGDYYLTSVTGILWYMMDGYTHTMGASNTNRTPSMTPWNCFVCLWTCVNNIHVE